jgi:hypothetical protein
MESQNTKRERWAEERAQKEVLTASREEPRQEGHRAKHVPHFKTHKCDSACETQWKTLYGCY